MNSIRLLVTQGASTLAGVTLAPRKDAALLLGRVLNRDQTWLLANPDMQVSEEQAVRFQLLISRRARHEPIQYILGEQEFYGLPLRVTPAVLIPRPETEYLVEGVLERAPRDRAVRIADVGTGSGAIALALAKHLPHAHIDALDFSPDALAVAEENARTLGLSEQVRFLQSDSLSAVTGERYDCIVSNPPYVASVEVLEPQVALWEPHTALFAGSDGLDVYRALLPQAAEHLRDNGLLALELGAGQQPALDLLFKQDERWAEPTFLPDLQGIPRVALARLRLG